MDTKPKPFVFVLMPFEDQFNDIYAFGIKMACERAGAYCERVDEQIFVSESILARIFNQIYKADIIVSDMTSRNPNVFYETGYAHALNKQVIMLTQHVSDIPFDLQHYPHIIYGGSIEHLQKELETRVRWCIENPSETLSSVEIDLGISLNRISVENCPAVSVVAQSALYGWFLPFIITVHNLAPKVIEPNSYNLAMLLPSTVEIDSNTTLLSSTTWISDEQYLVNLRNRETLFPDGRSSISVNCRVPFSKIPALSVNPVFPMVIRVFTALGPQDFPAQVKIDLSEILAEKESDSSSS